MSTTFDLARGDQEQREQALRTRMSRLPVPVDMEVTDRAALAMTGQSASFGSLFLISCHGRGALLHRPRVRVREDHEPTLMLSVLTSGTARVEQDDRVADLTRGDLVAYSSVRPLRSTFDGVAKHTFMVGYRDLRLTGRVLDPALSRRITARHPLGFIVAQHLANLGSHGSHLPETDRAALERPTLDLLRALFTTASGDRASAAEPVHAALGARLVAYLDMHLRDPGLTVTRLARAHGISERYAYLVLSRMGISLGDWLRTRRLAGAAEHLLRPEDSIAAVAHHWGFPDHANFTRAFRRAYGTSPREFRRSAQVR